MLFKILLLISVSAALSYHLQVTPDELKEFFQYVDTQVKGLLHETMIEIRTNVVPLAWYSDLARDAIYMNMSTFAQPYWAQIKSLEDEAKAQGQNISECISLGNEQLYLLNNSIAHNARAGIDFYEDLGNQALNYSAKEAYSVFPELLALEQVVALCNDETCATSVMKTVTQYFARAKAALIDAETKARNYVLDYLPVILTEFQVDSNAYVANYTVFLNDITDCIDKL